METQYVIRECSCATTAFFTFVFTTFACVVSMAYLFYFRRAEMTKEIGRLLNIAMKQKFDGVIGEAVTRVVETLGPSKQLLKLKIHYQGKDYTHFIKTTSVKKNPSNKLFAIDDVGKKHEVSFFYMMNVNYEPAELDSSYRRFVYVDDGKNIEYDEGEQVTF